MSSTRSGHARTASADDAAELLQGNGPGVMLVGPAAETRRAIRLILDRLSDQSVMPVGFAASGATPAMLRQEVGQAHAARPSPDTDLLLVVAQAERLSPDLLHELEMAAEAAAAHGGLKFLFAAPRDLSASLQRAELWSLAACVRTCLPVLPPPRPADPFPGQPSGDQAGAQAADRTSGRPFPFDLLVEPLGVARPAQPARSGPRIMLGVGILGVLGLALTGVLVEHQPTRPQLPVVPEPAITLPDLPAPVPPVPAPPVPAPPAATRPAPPADAVTTPVPPTAAPEEPAITLHDVPASAPPVPAPSAATRPARPADPVTTPAPPTAAPEEPAITLHDVPASVPPVLAPPAATRPAPPADPVTTAAPPTVAPEASSPLPPSSAPPASLPASPPPVFHAPASQMAAVPSREPANTFPQLPAGSTLPPANPPSRTDTGGTNTGRIDTKRIDNGRIVPLMAPAWQASLLLMAGPNDTLSSLYAQVYRGTTPPPFAQVMTLNPVVRSGVRLVFPAPSAGWPAASPP